MNDQELLVELDRCRHHYCDTTVLGGAVVTRDDRADLNCVLQEAADRITALTEQQARAVVKEIRDENNTKIGTIYRCIVLLCPHCSGEYQTHKHAELTVMGTYSHPPKDPSIHGNVKCPAGPLHAKNKQILDEETRMVAQGQCDISRKETKPRVFAEPIARVSRALSDAVWWVWDAQKRVFVNREGRLIDARHLGVCEHPDNDPRAVAIIRDAQTASTV